MVLLEILEPRRRLVVADDLLLQPAGRRVDSVPAEETRAPPAVDAMVSAMARRWGKLTDAIDAR